MHVLQFLNEGIFTRLTLVVFTLVIVSSCAYKSIEQGGAYDIVKSDGKEVIFRYDTTKKTTPQVVKMVGTLCSGPYAVVEEKFISPTVKLGHYDCLSR